MAKKSAKKAESKEIRTIVGNVGRCSRHNLKSGDYFYFLSIAEDTDHGPKWVNARVFGEARSLIEGRTYDFAQKKFVDLDGGKLQKGELVRATGAYEDGVWDARKFGKTPAHFVNCLSRADLVRLDRPKRPKTHAVNGF